MMLGNVIRSWREHNRYGIREAAKIIGTSQATLSRIENGKPCDAKTLIRLLDWMLHEEKP